MIRFAKGERKLEVMRPHLDRLARAGRCGVAAIGVAQEFQRVFTGTTYHPDADGGGVPRFGYHKAHRRVTANSPRIDRPPTAELPGPEGR